MIYVEIKNVSPRLTVSQTRAVIKVPPGTSDVEIARLVLVSSNIVPLARRYNVTLRGVFDVNQITMRGGEKNHRYLTLTYDEDGRINSNTDLERA